MRRLTGVAAAALLAAAPAAAQVRVKDVTDVAGAQGNHLYGFGLVVGLDGTGGRNTFTQKVAVDMLQRFKVSTSIFSPNPADSVFRATSLSAVMVTAEIGPFTRVGGQVDVTVSVMDDARSLQGGTLIFTPLRGPDGEVYINAQGPLSVGGFAASGQAAGVQKNHLNVGRIPGGGRIVKEAPGTVLVQGKAQLLLKRPDDNTARLIAKAVNQRFPGAAVAADAGSVVLCPPPNPCKPPTEFLAEVGLLEVQPDGAARVVINERTGTIVMGGNVTIAGAAIAHGNLYLSVAETPVVSQPNAFGGGTTTVVPRTAVRATEQQNRLVVVPKSVTVAEVARALNALGVTPRDLIAIFQALKEANALQAELVII